MKKTMKVISQAAAMGRIIRHIAGGFFEAQCAHTSIVFHATSQTFNFCKNLQVLKKNYANECNIYKSSIYNVESCNSTLSGIYVPGEFILIVSSRKKKIVIAVMQLMETMCQIVYNPSYDTRIFRIDFHDQFKNYLLVLLEVKEEKSIMGHYKIKLMVEDVGYLCNLDYSKYNVIKTKIVLSSGSSSLMDKFNRKLTLDYDFFKNDCLVSKKEYLKLLKCFKNFT